MEKGIDISGWQSPTSTVVTTRLADPTYTNVICKATEGVGVDDSKYATHIVNVRKAGKKAGAYHFAWPNQDPIAEAKHFVDVAKLLPGEIACLDLENWDSANGYKAMTGIGWPQRIAYALTWLREVKRLTGATAFVYMNWDWIKNFRSNSTVAQWAELCTYPLWLADYDSKAPGVFPTVDPKVAGGVTLTVVHHQWTNNDGGLDGNALMVPEAWKKFGVPSPVAPDTTVDLKPLLDAVATLTAKVTALETAVAANNNAIAGIPAAVVKAMDNYYRRP